MGKYMAIVAALVLGLVVGLLVMSPRLDRLTTALAESENANAALSGELARKSGQLDDMRARLERMEHDLLDARQKPTAETEPPMEQTSTAQGESLNGFLEDLAATLQEAEPTPSQGRRRGFDPEREFDPERRREWEERRQEFASRFRERVSDFIQSEIDATGDKAAKDRLAALQEYTGYMMDLRRELHDADTEERREELRTELDQAGETVRALVREQQDSIMRDVLQQQGITSSNKQDELISAMRDAQSSPFFSGPLAWGGGRGGHGGHGGPPGPPPE